MTLPDDAAYQRQYDQLLKLAQQHRATQNYAALADQGANFDAVFAWALDHSPEQALILADEYAEFLNNQNRFETRLQWFTALDDRLKNHPNRTVRANALNSLGATLTAMPTGDRRAQLAQAINVFHAALAFYTVQQAPDDHAMVQNNLGSAHLELSKIEDRQRQIKQAIEAYQAALKIRSQGRKPNPLTLANTEINLGSAYQELATVENNLSNLKRAIDLYHSALRRLSPREFPLRYAQGQRTLAQSYRELSNLEKRLPHLQNAQKALEEALRYLTPQTSPLDYGLAQNALGNVLQDIALQQRSMSDKTNLMDKAIRAFQNGGSSFTPDLSPANYALIQNNLGTALANLSNMLNSKVHLERAIAAFIESLKYRTETAAPFLHATTQNNLGNAYRNLAFFESPEQNLQRAVECFNAALKIQSPAVAPIPYATTMANLGLAYQALGDLQAALDAWMESEKHFRQRGYQQNANAVQEWMQNLLNSSK